MLVLVVLFALLVTVPVAQTSSFAWSDESTGEGFVSFNDTDGVQLCPSGMSTSVSYASEGVSARFTFYTPSGTSLFSTDAASANATVVPPVCGLYLLNENGTGVGSWSVHGSFHYSAPIL